MVWSEEERDTSCRAIMLIPASPGPLPRFIVLYSITYAGFGVASPFWPRFFEARGLSPEELGILFGLGTLMRLVAGPLANRAADLWQALRAVFAGSALMGAALALGLPAVGGFWPLLLLHLCHSATLAPITTLADALAVHAAAGSAHRKGFEYGWVRGSASAAFIGGTLLAGQVLSGADFTAIAWMQAALLAGAAAAGGFVPPLDRQGAPATATLKSAWDGFRALYRNTPFRRLLVVTALIYGSHAMHDAFAVIRWGAAGIDAATASMLWSEAVAAEVVVFFLVGPILVDRLGPRGAAAIAAFAGVIRWIVMAQTADLVALALVQPLHGLTFALLHLACMRLIGTAVPAELAATAQGIYAAGGGVTTALLTVASGGLYGRFGADAFLAMAALCAIALPLSLRLR